MKFNDYLKNKNLSVKKISDVSGIPYTTLSKNIENPDIMKASNLHKLSGALNLNMDELWALLYTKKNSLFSILLEQKRSKIKGNLYHFTQINFAYNSNHIEGSQLSEDETRFIYETNTLLDGEEGSNIDDVVETANHFYLFDIMLEEVPELLSEHMIKKYHQLLKNGTRDSRKEWFNVGEYKKLPNEVGGKETSKPERVALDIRSLLTWYNNIKTVTIDEIIEFHYKFECIHPFQDGNGRIGRIIMFRECLKHGIIPFIIEERYKAFYYRGLSEYMNEKNWLVDTCLTMQDNYKDRIDSFIIDKI